MFTRQPSNHLPLAISFTADKWRSQLDSLISAKWFDDPSLLVASDPRTYGCSLHPPAQYDPNPSQLWIGKPASAVLVRGSNGFIRLPDSFVALFLAYALDQYGINPALVLSLMARQSGINIQPTKDGDFIVHNSNAVYDCFKTGLGGCADLVKGIGGSVEGGPYQASESTMAMDLSIMATRMAVNTTRKEGRPLYASHHYFLSGKDALAGAQSEWSRDLGRATVRMALELHWLHTVVFTLDQVGMRGPEWDRRTRFSRDQIEFAIACHAFAFGLFSGSLGPNLTSCPADSDPIK